MNNIIPYLGRGIYHEQRGMPCQDAIAYRRHENGNLVMALSDGAGQGKYAREAAIRTVKSLRDFFERMELSDFLAMDEDERKTRLLEAVRKKLKEDEFFLNRNAPEFSATALFVVMDEQTALFGHLGDGAIYAANADGEIIYSSDPENRDSASGTWFCVSADAEAHLRMECAARAEIGAVILLSDGPYLMFRNRGKARAATTAAELMGYARHGKITGRTDLRNVLNRMTDIPSERLDDWSVILWVDGQEQEPGTCQGEAISMLREEEEKPSAIPATRPEEPPVAETGQTPSEQSVAGDIRLEKYVVMSWSDEQEREEPSPVAEAEQTPSGQSVAGDIRFDAKGDGGAYET